MERIKVSLPASFPFSTILTVRITDLNYGGHVGNNVFLSYAHEARQQFLQFYGYTEVDFAGTGLIISDAAIEFKKELFHKDEIKISVAVSAFDKLGFDFLYLVEVKENESWKVACKIKTGMVCFDYAAKKTVRVPADAIEKLSAANKL